MELERVGDESGDWVEGREEENVDGEEQEDEEAMELTVIDVVDG